MSSPFSFCVNIFLEKNFKVGLESMTSYKIMIVEDEKISALMLKQMLSNLGYSVSAIVTSGEESIRKLDEIRPDLILMDIVLSGDMDGIKAAKKIQSRFDIPIVFLTAHSDEGTIKKAKAAGPYGYLVKPVEINDLHVTLEMAISKHAMEMKLRESEEKFRVISSSAFDAIFMMNSDGNISFWNEAARKMFGYTGDEAFGINLLTRMAPKRFHEVYDKKLLKFQRTQKGNALGDTLELTAVRKNGEEFPIELSISTVKIQQDWNTIGIIRDITERKKAEEELRRRNDQDVLIYEIVRRLSRELKIDVLLPEIVNTLYQAFHFYSVMLFLVDKGSNDLNLKSIAGGYSNVFPSDLRIKIGEGLIGRAFSTEKTQVSGNVRKNKYYICKTGEITKSELVVPLISRKEVLGVLDMQSTELNAFNEFEISAVEAISTSIAVALENARLYDQAQQEISDRKKAEKRVRRAHAELDQMFNTAVDGMRVIDINFNVIRVNETFVNLANNTKEENINKKCYQVLHGPLCHTQACPLISLQKSEERIENETITKRTDGSEVICIMTATPFRNPEGQFIGIVENFKDITQRKKIESQLVQAQKLESIGQLAAGIAHEINTPTQYVSDNIQFLEESFSSIVAVINKYDLLLKAIESGSVGSKLTAEVKESAEKADLDYIIQEIPGAIEQSMEGIHRIAHIVRAMKDFSHPGNKEKTSIDINKAVETTITVSRNEWKYIAEMETDFDERLPNVPCFPNEFNQVILNMITNAAFAIENKLGEGSSQKGTIMISTRHIGNWAEIRISDTGTGIPESIRNKIFDPFFTTKEVGKGTGQGLAISHSVITEKHRGTITFDTKMGVGTTFIIRLPVNNIITNSK